MSLKKAKSTPKELHNKLSGYRLVTALKFVLKYSFKEIAGLELQWAKERERRYRSFK